MERCPNCRARLVREQEECQRCRMVLDTLWKLRADAALLDKAVACALLDGDLRGAERLLEQRLHLKKDSFFQQLQAFLKTV